MLILLFSTDTVFDILSSTFDLNLRQESALQNLRNVLLLVCVVYISVVCVDVWVVLLCFVQSTREIWCTCILVPMSMLAG